MTLTGSGGNGAVDSTGGNIGLAGNLSGTGGLNKVGPGRLTLGGSNTYTGGTSILAGTLQLANSNATLNSTVNVLVDNGLQFNSAIGAFNLGGLAGGNLLTLADTSGAAVTLNVGGNGASTTYSGAIGGSGGLTKVGLGMLTLLGSNNYAGNTTVNGGTLQLAGGSLVSPTQLVGSSSNGSFVQTGGSNYAASGIELGVNSSVAGTYVLSGGSLSTPFEIVGDTGSGAFVQTGGTHMATQLYFGWAGSASGSYALSQNGLLATSGEQFSSGTFSQSGGTNSAAAFVYIGDDTYYSVTYSLSGGYLTTPQVYLGSNGTGTVTQTGGTSSISSLLMGQNPGSSGTYNLNGGSLALSSAGLTKGSGAAAFNFGGGTLGASAAWSSSLAMTLTGSGGISTVDTTGGSIGLSGVLSGTNALIKVGPNSLTLGGSNTYLGPTSVAGGTLLVGPSGSIAGASAITVSNSSTLAVTASTNLRGSTITVNPGSLFDTTGASSFSLAAGNLLTIGRPAGLGSDINGNFTLGGGTLNIGGTGIAATLTEAGNLTLAGGSLKFDLSASGASDLAYVTGLNLSAPTALAFNVTGGSLNNGNYPLIDYSGSLTGSASSMTLSGLPTGATRQSFTLATSGGALLLEVANGSPASLVWTGSLGTAWDTTTLNWSNSGTADKFYAGDAVTFNDTANTAAVALASSLQPQSVLFNNNVLNYTLSGSGGISGNATLTKTAAGA